MEKIHIGYSIIIGVLLVLLLMPSKSENKNPISSRIKTNTINMKSFDYDSLFKSSKENVIFDCEFETRDGVVVYVNRFDVYYKNKLICTMDYTSKLGTHNLYFRFDGLIEKSIIEEYEFQQVALFRKNFIGLDFNLVNHTHTLAHTLVFNGVRNILMKDKIESKLESISVCIELYMRLKEGV